MIGVSDLISIFQFSKDFVNDMQYRSLHDTKDYENTLKALYKASRETKFYISTFEENGIENKEKEKELSELWCKAGIKLRKYNSDLAERLIIKSDYWTDPNSWSKEQVNESEIALDSIINESRKLI